jgi:N-acetylglutamate synthase-like GNAT family acetyltransferase
LSIPLLLLLRQVYLVDIVLRPATQDDAAPIKALVRAVRINPMDLKWQNFIVAVDAAGEFIGCGQVKTHGDGSRELASIAVVEAFRGQGVARSIIERLLADHPQPLYLTCRSSLGSFYEKFGFRGIEEDDMSPYFKRINRLGNVMIRFMRPDEYLLVMKKEG